MNTDSNALIDLLHTDAKRQMLELGEVVEITANSTLWESNKKSRYAWWPYSGVVSVMACLDRLPRLELRMVGQEGLVGLHLLMGFATSSMTATVRVPGLAMRCDRPALRMLCSSNVTEPGSFSNIMARYCGAVVAQLGTFAVCLRFHHIEQRLAMWMLMAQDRAHTNHLHITQEALSVLLGVRRVSVTNAATVLQDLGLIYYRRGEISVLNRKGLEGHACNCWRLDTQLYQRHMRSQRFAPDLTDQGNVAPAVD